MADWVATWNWMQIEFQHVEDARIEFDEAFGSTSKSSRLEKANASVEYAKALCRFLSKARDHGVFDSILESQGTSNQLRDELASRVAEFLREEEILMERAKLKPESIAAILKDMRNVTQPPYYRVTKDLWDRHLKEAIGVACNFAKAGMVLAARNMFDYVQQVRKEHKWVYVAVVATVDGISAAVDPTFVGTAKVSGWVAALMGGHDADSGDPPPIST
jgi:hypothetical protein